MVTNKKLAIVLTSLRQVRLAITGKRSKAYMAKKIGVSKKTLRIAISMLSPDRLKAYDCLEEKLSLYERKYLLHLPLPRAVIRKRQKKAISTRRCAAPKPPAVKRQRAKGGIKKPRKMRPKKPTIRKPRPKPEPSDRNKQIAIEVYEKRRSYADVGRQYGISRERVRQIAVPLKASIRMTTSGLRKTTIASSAEDNSEAKPNSNDA